MIKILAIYDTDVNYVARLMDYIKKKPVLGFEVMAFTLRESLEEYLRSGLIEILLIGEDIKTEEMIPGESIRYIFVLSEQKAVNAKDTTGIYKYQAVRGLLSDILSCYTRLENGNNGRQNGDHNNRVISIFTPLCGSLEVMYSWFLATCLANKKKVLYLPMELLPVSAALTAEGENQSLSEFIYYLKENNPNLILKLNHLLKFSGKLTFLSGISHGLDLLSLNKEDAVRLVEELKKNTDYEVIIFYLGMYSEFTIELMSLSDMVHILGKGGPYPISVGREWERQMRILSLDPGKDKYRRITLPVEEPVDIGTGDGTEQNHQKLWQLALQLADEL